MAFKYKQHKNGNANDELGEKISIYDKYMVVSSVSGGIFKICERKEDGNWETIREAGPIFTLGESANMYKKKALIGFRQSDTAILLEEDDDFLAAKSLFNGGVSADGYGKSVSMSDNYVAVGAPEYEDAAIDNDSGAVSLFSKEEDEEWRDVAVRTSYQLIRPNDPSANQFFGTSVDINENFLIVGAKGDNSNRGAVYIFERNEETGIWEQLQKIIASDGVSGDGFGCEVSLSGDYFAAGAEFADLSEQEVNVGAVYMFNYSTRWNELRKITGVGESGLIANNFGHSLDLQGDYLIVGSPNAQNSGVADIFYKKRNWGHLKKIDDTLTSTGDNFGEGVGIYYPYSVIGASGLVDTTDEGRVYFYEDPPVRLRLAQEFDADFQPSKASVYLKRSGSNSSSSWTLNDRGPSIIDASNFSSITDASGLTPVLDLTANTVAQYKMNDNLATTTVVNSIDSTEPAIYVGNNTEDVSADGIINRALDFQSGPKYIDTNQIFLSTFQDNFSINIWYKADDGHPPGTRTIYGQWSNPGENLVLTIRTSGAIRVEYIVDSVSMQIDTSVLLNDGPEDWHMLTFMAEQVGGSINSSLYMDTVLVGNDSETALLTASVPTENLYIGTENSGGGPSGIASGLLDNFCLFNKELTQDEIDFLYNSGFGTEEIVGGNGNIVFDDEINAFTGNGYMSFNEINTADVNNKIINYPIRNSIPGSYNVWFRVHTGSSDPSGSSVFDMDMLLDSIVVKNINSTIANNEWSWINTTLILPDTQQHILGIRMKEKDSAIDKIYIDSDSDFIPTGDGPPYITSPYATVHMKVYDSDGSIPTNSLEAYDYKTTLDEIIQDDWYNFDISLTDNIISEYGESLFLVMSSSGANADNFVAWEVIDSDEYFSWNTGLRLTEIALDSNLIDTSLTKKLYYKAKAGDADINTDTWYMDNTKTHAFKIYSDFDPIEEV